MNQLNVLYQELSKQYPLKWADREENAFYLFFPGKKRREYRLYVSAEYVAVEQKLKLFKWHWWNQKTHSHYDDDRSFADVYAGIQFYLKRYERRIGKTD